MNFLYPYGGMNFEIDYCLSCKAKLQKDRNWPANFLFSQTVVGIHDPKNSSTKFANGKQDKLQVIF